MPSDPTVAYLDANVLLAYVSGETDRAAVVDSVLTAAADGKLRAHTSTLSIVEVAYGASEKAAKRLDEEVEAAIDELWEAGSPILLIEPSVRVMRVARQFLRRALADDRSLKPADAVHLATATVHPDTTHVFTYEDAARRSYWAKVTGLAVDEPFLSQPPLPGVT